MSLYRELSEDIKAINEFWHYAIDIFCTNGLQWKDAFYVDSIFAVQRFNRIKNNTDKIVHELDILFVEDENRFDNSVKSYLNKLNESIDIIMNLRTHDPEFQSLGQKPKTRLLNKLIAESEIKKSFNKGDFKKCFMLHADFCIYSLFKLKDAIEQKESELKQKAVVKGKDSDSKQPTKRTKILQLYFENDCKPLKKTTVASRLNNGKQTGGMINQYTELHSANYNHNDNTNNKKAFYESYKYLIELFESNNKKGALKHVENRLKILKETYPEITS